MQVQTWRDTDKWCEGGKNLKINIRLVNYDCPSDRKYLVGTKSYLDSGLDIPNTATSSLPKNPIVSNSAAHIEFRKDLAVGKHEIWIIPKSIYTGTVGPGFNPQKKDAKKKEAGVQRVFRPLKLEFKIELDATTNNKTIHSCRSLTKKYGVAKLKKDTKPRKKKAKKPRKPLFRGGWGQQYIEASLRCVFAESPNKKTAEKLSSIVLHRTDDPTTDPASMSPAINTFLKKGRTSVHYIVDRDGHVCKILRDSERGNHAGKSYWDWQDNLSNCSIGIENVARDELDKELTGEQYVALQKLLLSLCQHHNIERHKIIGHGDIRVCNSGYLGGDSEGGQRNFCPGADSLHSPNGVLTNKFQWKLLADNGFGMKVDFSIEETKVRKFFAKMTSLGVVGLELKHGDYDPTPAKNGRFGGVVRSEFTQPIQDALVQQGGTSTPIFEVQSWLARIGYWCGVPDGKMGLKTVRAVRSLLIHFDYSGRDTASDLRKKETVDAAVAELVFRVYESNPSREYDFDSLALLRKWGPRHLVDKRLADAKKRNIFGAAFDVPDDYQAQVKVTEEKWQELDAKINLFYGTYLRKAIRRKTWGRSGETIWPDMSMDVHFDWHYTHLVIHHGGDSWTEKSPQSIEAHHLEGGAYADLGYHFIINQAGKIFEGRSLAFKGSHVKGANSGKIGICFSRDLNYQWWDRYGYSGRKFELTLEESSAFLLLAKQLKNELFSTIEFLVGHNEVSDPGTLRKFAGLSCPGQVFYEPDTGGKGLIDRWREKLSLKPDLPGGR